MMKLKRLFKDVQNIQIKGSKDLEINGICSNSKRVSPGNLFIAKKGQLDDGARYITEAVSGGSVAVLTDLFNPSLKHITQIIHPQVASVEGLLAATYYQNPSEEMFTVGVTGTNGKTTSSFIAKYFLDHLDSPTGLIGTIEYIIGANRYQSTLTTPDVVTNHRMLREMALQGCKSAIMEVSSHALDQGRVDHIHYDIAIFTNLTLEHLDYHGSMEAYAKTKNRLFRSLGDHKSTKTKRFAPCAVVNSDSPWSTEILKGCTSRVFTYGIENIADLQATQITLSTQGTQFILTYKKESIQCVIPLVGRYNVYNCLVATAVALLKGYSLRQIASLYASIPSVRGRLEVVPNALDLKIYVDFAHSDDALENVLECLTELKKGRIITVFGCGGDRDMTKRPKMASVVEKYSDYSFVTSDNPRSEDPEKICKETAKGFHSTDKYAIVVDRRQAIKEAVEITTAEDILLIAGKGHETYQIFAHKVVEFDDRKVAQEQCLLRKNFLNS